jgi:methyl-accepting chemotaxis protein
VRAARPSTQQNAALVEQSVSAAQSLRQRANELVDAASRFQLKTRQVANALED